MPNMKAPPVIFNLNVQRIRVAARHQCGEVVATTREDVSGLYVRLRRNTLYCADRSLFLDVSGFAKDVLDEMLRGKPVSLSSSRFS
jgi:hypothetical protein